MNKPKPLRILSGEEEEENGASLVDETEVSDNEENQNPLVFQCKKCKVVVGDTMSWVCTLEETGQFSLGMVTKKVEVTNIQEFADSGAYQGSSYVIMRCKNCHMALGRVYKATPRKLDHIRDMYTFDIENVESYELGSASSSIDSNIVHNLETRVNRLQCLFYYLSQRVKCIETALEIDPEAEMAQEIDPEAENQPECDMSTAKEDPKPVTIKTTHVHEETRRSRSTAVHKKTFKSHSTSHEMEKLDNEPRQKRPRHK